MFDNELDNFFQQIERLIDRATGNAPVESPTRERLYDKLADVVSEIDNRESLFIDFLQLFDAKEIQNVDAELKSFIEFSHEYFKFKSELGSEGRVEAKELLAAYDGYLKKRYNKKKIRLRKTRVAKAFNIYRQQIIFQEFEQYCEQLIR